MGELQKNTGSSNERVGFEQISIYQPQNTIAVATTCSQNSPGAVLLSIALYESCEIEAPAPRGNEIRASEDP